MVGLLITRLASGNRRLLNAAIPPDPAAIEQYRKNIVAWAKIVPSSYIINLDETKFHYVNPPRLVIYRKGHRHVIAAGAKPSHGMTAILCGSAAGDKLKPAIVVRCKPNEEKVVKAEHEALLGDTCVMYTSEQVELMEISSLITLPMLFIPT